VHKINQEDFQKNLLASYPVLLIHILQIYIVNYYLNYHIYISV